MTPAERALLLAVAKLLAAKHFPDGWRRSLTDAIAAVEAEAAPEAPTEADVCPTCKGSKGGPVSTFDGTEWMDCDACNGTGKKEKNDEA